MLGLKLNHISKRGPWWRVGGNESGLTLISTAIPVLIMTSPCADDPMPQHVLCIPRVSLRADYMPLTPSVAEQYLYSTRSRTSYMGTIAGLLFGWIDGKGCNFTVLGIVTVLLSCIFISIILLKVHISSYLSKTCSVPCWFDINRIANHILQKLITW